MYDLLVALVLTLGWNKLLELRSKVFVMESEYSSNNSNKNDGINHSNSNSNSRNVKGCRRLKETRLVIRKKRLCENGWISYF